MRKNKILIIDDETNIAETLADILKLKGFQVHTSSRGKTGFSMALEKKPDLILCDIMMPEMNGYEVLEAVREHKQTRQIPLVFLSAKDNAEDQSEAMSMGADDYLTKPVDMEALFRTIERRLHE